MKLAIPISFSAWTELNPVCSEGGAWADAAKRRYSNEGRPRFFRRSVIAGVFDHALRNFEKENDPIRRC